MFSMEPPIIQWNNDYVLLSENRFGEGEGSYIDYRARRARAPYRYIPSIVNFSPIFVPFHKHIQDDIDILIFGFFRSTQKAVCIRFVE